MILLYTSLIFMLGAAKLLISWRARSLEKKYALVAREADSVLKQPTYMEGNSNRMDPLAIARRQYMLGHLVQKRDQVETKYVAWQRWADRFKRYVAKYQSWKGKTLPYTFGAVDVFCILGLIDRFGVRDYLGVRSLVNYITGLFTG